MKNILLVAFFLLTSNLSVFSQEVLLSLSTRYIISTQPMLVGAVLRVVTDHLFIYQTS